jgi:ABC-type transport system substrate-binding protein
MVFLNFKNSLSKFKWPSQYQWRQFFKILSKSEKISFFIFLILALTSFSFLSLNFYFKNTKIVPAEGGQYIEGLLGQPQWLQPVYAQASDVDKDIVELLYSGLMKYDSENKLVPDLAKDYPQIKQEGKIFEFSLKENIFWQDGEKLTVDDVIFTLKTIQNPDYKSPLRESWLGVEIEKISENSLRFNLKKPYSAFLDKTTLKIMPKHIFEKIPAERFPLVKENLQPIGSGPYKLKEISKDESGFIKSLTLERFKNYFGKKPYIKEIKFLFFEKESDLILAKKEKKIKGLSLSWAKKDLLLENEFLVYRFFLPRYFALFFNPEKAEILKEAKVRKALNYATNKKEIIEKILNSEAKIVNSPILPEIFGFKEPKKIYQYDLERAKEILKEAGFLETKEGFRKKIVKKEPTFQFKKNLKKGDRGENIKELQKCLAKDPEIYPKAKITGYFEKETEKAVILFQKKYKKEIEELLGHSILATGFVGPATRKILNEICFKPIEEVFPLEFNLVTVDQPTLIEIANLLKEQWQKIGVKIEIKAMEISQLEKEIIKPKNYQILLFGQILDSIPDPFPFWHSFFKKEPGLNLASYENEKVDELLEKARQILDEKERAEKYEEFQEILIEDAPVVFLFNPHYLYFVSKKIKGVKGGLISDPSKRFSQIENWYLKTKRILK